MHITIETTVNASMASVWSAWVTPADIQQWNFASDDWQCPAAQLDLRPGGTFNYRMEARDGSMGFDFEGTFTAVAPQERIDFTLGDDRTVRVEFSDTPEGIVVTETFEAEDEHTAELQRQGWQSILDNFRRHVETGGR